MSAEQSEPAPRCTRRTFLAGAALGTLGGAATGWMARQLAFPSTSPTPSVPVAKSSPPLLMPGPYPGRVVEVHHPGSVRAEKRKGYTERDREAVKAMIERGMKELVGSDD